MTYPGTDKKWMVTTTQDDFSLAENDFEITVVDPYKRKRTITKNDCFYDSDGRFYFTTEKLLAGVYYVRFKGSYEDDDYDKQTREFTDVQKLVEVGACCCSGTPGCQCEHVVEYTEVTTVSVDGEDYLADCDGNYIYTSDGKRIQFTNNTSEEVEDMGKVKLKMTGDEFKQLIEGENPNGETDTVPELIRSASGISDDKTIKEEIAEQTEQAKEDVITEDDRVTQEELENFQV